MLQYIYLYIYVYLKIFPFNNYKIFLIFIKFILELSDLNVKQINLKIFVLVS